MRMGLLPPKSLKNFHSAVAARPQSAILYPDETQKKNTAWTFEFNPKITNR